MITCYAYDNECTREELKTTNGKFQSFIYYHGELEDHFGYDLVVTSEDLPDGEYPVDIRGSMRPAYARIWTTENSRRGLITFDNDYKSTEDAKKKYNEKARFL